MKSSAAAQTARQWRPRLRTVALHSSVRIGGSQMTRRYYQDVAFMWARKNPDVARACLQVPSPRMNTKNETRVTTFPEYYKCRNWNFDSVQHDGNELKWAQRLVSHVLSAPLTFAHHYSPSLARSKQQRVCIVGARAEATIPVEYWKEVLIITRYNRSNNALPISWTFDFCGPEVLTTSNNVILKNDDDTLTLQWSHTGYLHDMKEPPQWDGFVLFNPGLGHEHLRKGWLPTLDYLLSTEKPILLTAHSERDAQRDSKLLQQVTGRMIDYEPNVFASLITYQDPLSQDSHHVSPNSFVTLLS